MRLPFPRILVVLLLIPVCLSAYQLHAHPDRHVVTTRTAPRSPDIGPGDTPDVAGAVLASREAFFGEVQAQVDAYLASVEAERLAEEARQAAQRATQGVSRAPGNISGDCAPVAAIIGWDIVMRESGGNPNAANPSGAYGCSQTLLSHYYGGVCSGLDPYTVAGQTACTQILYDRGGLAPWAQTAN